MRPRKRSNIIFDTHVVRGRRGDDLYTAAAALGLGTSLFFIHIYVTPLKRFIQVL